MKGLRVGQRGSVEAPASAWGRSGLQRAGGAGEAELQRDSSAGYIRYGSGPGNGLGW